MEIDTRLEELIRKLRDPSSEELIYLTWGERKLLLEAIFKYKDL